MSFGLVPWWWGGGEGGEDMVTCAVLQGDAELDGGGVGVVDHIDVHDARTRRKPMMAASFASVSPTSFATRET